MRKFAGGTTPLQSKAAVTRFERSPPAAKKLATTRSSTKARNAIGSRNASRGGGQPALSLRADISARSTWARHSACATGSSALAAISSAIAVAGRCALAAAAVEPAQAVVQAGQPQQDERHGGGEREQREDDEPDGARRAAAARATARPTRTPRIGRTRSPARPAPATAAPTAGCRGRASARA